MKRLLCSALLLASPVVHAYDLPPLNLGATSYLDVAPAPPGLHILQYAQHYHADKFKDADGHDIPLPDPEFRATVGITQLIYGSEQKFLGGQLGFQAFIPYVNLHASYGIPGADPSTDSGMGDLVFGPLVTWGPLKGPGGSTFFHRIELTTVAPTGKYDRDTDINPGMNFWSFNPFWAGTLFVTPKLSASVRAHYLWNGKNDEPGRLFGAVDDTRAGQAFHVNFATAYAFTPSLRLGFNGYWLKQTTDTQVNGHDVDGRREQVLGLGVGGVYSFGQKDHLFFNFYDESQAENRTEGQRFNLRFVHSF